MAAVHDLALLTDLYQLTMAYGYWKTGRAAHEAVFHLSFRSCPFQSGAGGFAVAAGLGPALEFIAGYRFSPSDLDYLARLTGADDQPLFEHAFLDFLGDLRLSVDVDAIPEGTVVFAHEPLLRVRGPLVQGQLLETALLNLVNFHTLIATKAARICLAAAGDPVLEFGLRRAQGQDGALSASRAAYLGGCAGTSNVLAGLRYGIPVRGTHAHSWVMAFAGEEDAFEAYAGALPNNCIFLVDTYDTLEGVRRAAALGARLRARGQRLLGVRLDSGDLCELSIAARRILDDAGLLDADIVGTSDLDEGEIDALKARGAAISVWGVGTRLVTAYDQPALGGVYKLGAIRAPGGPWLRRLKLSNHVTKISDPGILQVRRYSSGGRPHVDVLFDEDLGLPDPPAAVERRDGGRPLPLPGGAEWQDLLVPVVRGGRAVASTPSLRDTRAHARAELDRFDAGARRRSDPNPYPVGIEAGLYRAKLALMEQARAGRFAE